MVEIKCIFQNIVLKNQDDIHEQYNNLVKEVNKASKIYNKEEMSKYFTFKSSNVKDKIINCEISFINDLYIGNLAYIKNGEKLCKGYAITKIEFIFQGKTYCCYEKNYMREYLNKEFNKKNFT